MLLSSLAVTRLTVYRQLSVDSGPIFRPTADIDAAFCLSAVVWGPFFEAVGLIVRATHEEHMNTKI